ncbi:Endonuclease/exonuclease/phosphatase [Parasponia andersonii]|uniref:Endonuclease/exonuclease/phosphatase n=1 Tax=Parasponia andersonii TaxID=3476 RepID=A0A2P5DCD0_PARAD|nr:Endonuclease/exonuclease/phosphatase [Parasponia andersonii]
MEFQLALSKCGLSDLGFVGPMVTWNNKKDGLAKVQDRLDRSVCSNDWRCLHPSAVVNHLDSGGSDHRAIILFLEENVKFRYNGRDRHFRLEPF